MRLDSEQIATIMQTVSRLLGLQVVVYLFGSRLNMQVKGGDIDLLIDAPSPITLLQRAQIKMELESLLGLPVDIVTKTFGETKTAFQTIAQSRAQRLEIIEC